MAESQERYKEMNRILIFSFLEIFMSEPFRDSFPDNPPPRLAVNEWITESNLPSAKRIVTRLKLKITAKNRTGAVQGEITAIQVQRELNESQVQQTYQAAYALSLFCVKDFRVYQ